MDVLSHALITVTIFLAAGSSSSLLPFAIVGAVIADADIFFRIISDKSPALYMFTHGGFAHSIPGAFVMSALATAGIQLAVLAGAIPAGALAILLPQAFFVILAGALIHICIDALAYPGIPVLYPLSDRKITAGILPGPSIVLFITSTGILIAWAFGRLNTPTALTVATVIVILFLTSRTVLFLGIRQKQPRGRCVPLPNPLQWLIIGENKTSFIITRYSLSGGTSGTETFEKYTNTNMSETEKFLALPEVRRLKFHSYISVVEKTRSGFIFSDPLREKGYFFYPPDYRHLVIPVTPVLPVP
ncbi:MAG: metal-dependent hydrolase [Methanoregula sp.]|nr:metal-dependent hydrolase [Methanoregula sp.]